VLVGGAEDDVGLAHLPVETIVPNARQPRRRFDREAADALAESVRTDGLLQPVVVRPLADGRYELIAGERRWRAARAAGVPTVPAVVRETDDRDSLLLALVENVAREQLSPVEEARAYAVLLDEFGLTLGEVAARVGRSKPAVSNRLRLLDLPDDVLELVERGELTDGHARAVLAVQGHDERRLLARRIVRSGLSVRGAERAAREAGSARRPRGLRVDPALAERAAAASQRLTGRRSRVVGDRLEITFADETELAELVEVLEASAAQV
jgi:ParB family chromosome partitioning protein